MHKAASEGKLEIVGFFVSKGADIRITKPFRGDGDSEALFNSIRVVTNFFSVGETPLDLARKKGHTRTAAYLLEKEALGLFGKNDDKALKLLEEVYGFRKDELGPNHPDTLNTRHNMAGALYNQRNDSKALAVYQEVFNVQKDILGPDHPDTLMTRSNIETVRKEMDTESQREPQRQESECSIQSYQRQQKAYFHLSEFISNNLQNVPIKPVKQGLYLPSFETRNVKISGKCTAITRAYLRLYYHRAANHF